MRSSLGLRETAWETVSQRLSEAHIFCFSPCPLSLQRFPDGFVDNIKHIIVDYDVKHFVDRDVKHLRRSRR